MVFSNIANFNEHGLSQLCASLCRTVHAELSCIKTLLVLCVFNLVMVLMYLNVLC